MTTPALKVLQVSPSAQGGGAERIALTLHQGLRRRGQRSWMAVGQRNLDDPDIFAIPKPATPAGFGGQGGLLRRVSRAALSPRKFVWRRLGRESFDYPGTRRLLTLPPSRPNLVHCHNLHGGYFDLRQLAPLSRTVPVLMTLHDEWTYTGHCAYTMGIERWRTGCHSCPDLGVYPAIRRDSTHANWLAKRGIYRASRLHVSAPSQWLLDRAKDSILSEGAVDWRVIPNGVDLETFHPADRPAARRRLDLPQDALILLFTANRARSNPFKDYATVETAARLVARALPARRVLLLPLGEAGASELDGNLEIRPTGYETQPERVAAFFQASDLYLHAANADNLPTTIIEAAAVGLPVVATAIGGIPEIVRSLSGIPGGWGGSEFGRAQATGALVEAGDASAMARAAVALLVDEELRLSLGAKATADAASRYDLERQVDDTLAWYHEVLAD